MERPKGWEPTKKRKRKTNARESAQPCFTTWLRRTFVTLFLLALFRPIPRSIYPLTTEPCHILHSSFPLHTHTHTQACVVHLSPSLSESHRASRENGSRLCVHVEICFLERALTRCSPTLFAERGMIHGLLRRSKVSSFIFVCFKTHM